MLVTFFFPLEYEGLLYIFNESLEYEGVISIYRPQKF